MLRRSRFLGKTLLSLSMICCLTDVTCCDERANPAYDVSLHRLEQIAPGTVLDKEAPKGWSNLLIKSYSRPGAGDVKQLSAAADRLTRLLFTAILADVQSDKDRRGVKHYRLAKIAVGLGTRIRDKDTIITPDTQKKFGANLGLLARVVLRTAQEKLEANTVVTRAPSLMVFDSPSFLLVDGKHKSIVLRYAVLVEERTGRLDTLVWALGREDGGKYSDPIGAIQWLSPNRTDDNILHVDGQEFSLGQPTERAFALTAPPKGKKEIEVGDDLKSLLARPRFSPATAAELETKLREALKKASDK
jgi:hypothetical protein